MIDSSDIRRLLDSGCISPEQADQIRKLYGLATYPPRDSAPAPSPLPLDEEYLAKAVEHTDDQPISIQDPVASVEKILPSAPVTPRPDSPLLLFIKRNYLALILSTLGALLIIGGLSTLVVANWQNTPRWVKMLEAIALMGGFWAGGFYLKEINGKFVRTGISLYVVGMCMWGICLKLFSFLYDVSSSPSHGILLFTLGIAAFPWILRVKAIFGIFMASVLLFGVSSMNDPNAPWAFQTLVPLIGLCFWGLGAFLPFIAKGYYALYARLSKICGLGIFLFSLLYARVQNWGEISFLTNVIPLAFITGACMIWDYADSSSPTPLQQNSTWRNRKTFIYSSAAILSLGAVACIPPSLNWIVLMLLSISTFFLSGTSSRWEKLTILVFLSLLCILSPSPRGLDGTSFFFHHGILIAPLVLAFSFMLSKLRNQSKEASFLNNVALGFYMALAGYNACNPHLLPNGFIHILQMATPWVFALTLFIKERNRESLIQIGVMLCVTIAGLIGSTDAGFWISVALLIYLFMRAEKKCISSLVFALWLYGCLIFSLDYEFTGIALPILLIAFIKRGASSWHNNIIAQNIGSFLILLIQGFLFLYAISEMSSPLFYADTKAEEWIKILPMALIPLGFLAIEQWKEQDRTLPSIAGNLAFLLIVPAMLLNSQVMFALCLFLWAFLSIIQRASSIASLLSNPPPREQVRPFSQSTIFQSFCMFSFLALLAALSYEVYAEFIQKHISSARLFYWVPVLSALYTAAILIYHSGHRIARRFYGTVALLIPAFSAIIISFPLVVKDMNTLGLFIILPWILSFAVLVKCERKTLLPGIAALLITVVGLFLPEWALLALFSILLLASFLGNSKYPAPFLLHGFALLSVIIITNILDHILVPAIPLACLAGSLLLLNTPLWKNRPKLHLSEFTFLALCLLVTHFDIIATHPTPYEVSICGAIALACFIRLGINIRKHLYPSPIFAIIDTTMLIAMIASIWAGAFTTTFFMLGYGAFRVVTWKTGSIYSPVSSLVTGSLFSFALFVSILSPIERYGVPASIFYMALLTAMVASKMRHETENLALVQKSLSISRIGQISTLALFLPLCWIYSSLRNAETFPIWLICILLIPAWMGLSSAIIKKKFLPEIALLSLPAFLFIEGTPTLAKLAVFALCGLCYLISGYRMEITSPVKKYQFETILGLAVIAILPIGITSCHGVFNNPLPFITLYLPILLMAAALYAKPFQPQSPMLLQKIGMFALIILSQFYCYTDHTTRIDWSTLCFFAIPGIIMLIPLLANRKFFGTPLIILMVASGIAVPAICPNFSLGYVIAALILMGATFLSLGMRICSATYVTSGIIMMSLVSFSIIFRVFDSRVERGVSLLICGIAFLILAFIAERTRHFLIKKMNEQSTSNPS